jgi:site-specific recombinase XerC
VPGVKRKHPRVHIEPDPRRTDEQGRPYLLLRWRADGKSNKEPIGHLSSEEAEERRADKEAELRLGITPTSPASRPLEQPATVADAVEHFLAELPNMPGKPDHHRWETTRALHLDRLLGTVALTGLTSSRLRAYVTKRKGEHNEPRKRKDRDEVVPERQERRRKLAPQVLTHPRRVTVQNELSCLRRIVKAWGETGHTVPVLPATKDLLKGWEEDHRPPRQLTEGDVRALVAAGTYTVTSGTFKGRDRSKVGRLIGFLAWCPRRPVAVFALRMKDCSRVTEPGLERKERRIWFERDKGGKKRGFTPLTGPALRYLRDQLEARAKEGAKPDDLVWVTENGHPWTAQTFWRVVKATAARAKLEDVTTYDLRKFGAAMVYRRKSNLKVVMQYSGHKNPSVLLKNYIFPERDEAEEAAEHIEWSAPAVRLVAEQGAGDDDVPQDEE